MRFLTTPDLWRMKFSKIQKFPVALKIWLEMESLTTLTCKGWNFAKSRTILICVENLAQKCNFWPLQTCKGWNFAKSRTILICVENLAQKCNFWPLQTCKGWNLAKFRNFQSRWKIWLEIESLTTPDLLRMKFCKIKKFWFMSKTSSKLTFLTTHNMQRMKFGTIQKFSVESNIWLKIETFNHSGPAKDEIWQHPEIWSSVENLAQIDIFKKDQRRMKFCKILAFSAVLKIWHFWPLRTWEGWNLQNLEIFIRSENLAQIES